MLKDEKSIQNHQSVIDDPIPSGWKNQHHRLRVGMNKFTANSLTTGV